MSAHKRLLLLASLTAVLTTGATSTANAQMFRRRAVWVSPVVVLGGYYGNPYWYDPWYGYYMDQYPWGPYPYPPYRIYNMDPGAAVRLEVKPKEAEVYVDGYYAGIVDDFDGMFQRLSITPGEHQLDLYLDGYRPVHQKVYLSPRGTFKIRYTMERLGPGEQVEARPQPPNPPPQAQPGAPPMYPQPGRPPVGRRGPQGPSQQPQPPPGAPRGADASTYGSLAIRVQPADAEILIDGEPWRGPDMQDRLVVEVPEGQHTVEIRKSGYRTYVTDVQVRRGETTPVNVSLRTQEQP